MRNMIYWWIFFWIQAVAYGFAWYLGIFKAAAAADISYITSAVVVIHVLTTLWIGVMTSQQARFGDHNFHEDTGWFMSEVVMMLGMIGTIVGFIFTLVSTLGTGVDASQINAVVSNLAKGIGTAGWTTLFGLIAALSIKAQMNNLESLSAKPA